MSLLSRHLNELQRVNRPICGVFRHLDSKTYYSNRCLSMIRQPIMAFQRILHAPLKFDVFQDHRPCELWLCQRLWRLTVVRTRTSPLMKYSVPRKQTTCFRMQDQYCRYLYYSAFLQTETCNIEVQVWCDGATSHILHRGCDFIGHLELLSQMSGHHRSAAG